MSSGPYVLLLSCPDSVGIVAAVSGMLADLGANIVEADQHLDPDADVFVQRVAFAFEGEREVLRAGIAPVAERFAMDWTLHEAGARARLAVLVSREGHCLHDLLARVSLDEFDADVVLVASNHETHAGVESRFGVPFVCHPVTGDDGEAQEQRMRESLAAADVDLVILARYMRILSAQFCDEYRGRSINIHHSFLPAFAGARPYHRAHARGVKLIGATAHYVTEDLDQGPIIAQDVAPVSHRDDVERLVRRGRDLEKLVLATAVRYHLEHRVLVYGNRTVVFD